jgi:tetratricopeptide (TPR) repeat protein
LILRRIGVAALVLAMIGVAGASRARLEQFRADESGDELLYLPNGKYLRVMSLGHRTLMADAVYLWAIQFYSNYEREGRYRYVEHVFSNVITELDPHYIDAYWLGALILIIEAGDLDAGLDLLEKGMDANPKAWILPYLAAWECYRTERFDRAAAYFERAMEIPEAPAVLRRLRAGMFSKKGDLRVATRLWQEILEDEDADEASRAIARRQMRDLKISFDVRRLDAAVQRFRKDNGRFPTGLAELERRTYIDDLPTDPEGRAYRYDAETGRIWSPAGRVLGAR